MRNGLKSRSNDYFLDPRNFILAIDSMAERTFLEIVHENAFPNFLTDYMFPGSHFKLETYL